MWHDHDSRNYSHLKFSYVHVVTYYIPTGQSNKPIKHEIQLNCENTYYVYTYNRYNYAYICYNIICILLL